MATRSLPFRTGSPTQIHTVIDHRPSTAYTGLSTLAPGAAPAHLNQQNANATFPHISGLFQSYETKSLPHRIPCRRPGTAAAVARPGRPAESGGAEGHHRGPAHPALRRQGKGIQAGARQLHLPPGCESPDHGRRYRRRRIPPGGGRHLRRQGPPPGARRVRASVQLCSAFP